MIKTNNITTSRVLRVLKYLFVIAMSLSMIIPFLWMLSASFKDSLEVFASPFKWIPKVPKFENYSYIWQKANYLRLFLNTAKLTVIITVLQLVTGSLAGYAFSKLEFPERNKLFLLYLATLMIPYQVVMIPQFSIIRLMGLSNTHMALIVIQAFDPMGVFLMKQFFDRIPKELNEAAKIDGLSEFGTYLRVIMPLSKSVIGTLIILSSVKVWNDFLAPLIYLNSEKLFTIQLGLRNMISEFSAEYGPIMAASVISIIPILIIFLRFQKFFEQSITSSGVKG
ncbi:carbohydrate ABC transporter permease [uncultured Sphaerochaeta sp.]|uniref:carbohydrate ABC transporter permease n=1 Tax=uncultured Sphaerochaeta sp. TaxID=886478 RepID=UPI002A0A1E5D|nr:carbohydrate ABC transporter permease [uncultured Sphaerochaeta sp.]